MRFFKRAGEPGELDGNVYTFQVPNEPAAANYAVTFIASDGTAGNSYCAERVSFIVTPGVHAQITSDALVGPAPLTVKVLSEGSRVAEGMMEVGWEFYRTLAGA